MAQFSAGNSCWSLTITEYQIEIETELSRKLVGCNLEPSLAGSLWVAMEAAADEAVAVLEARWPRILAHSRVIGDKPSLKQ